MTEPNLPGSRDRSGNAVDEEVLDRLAREILAIERGLVDLLPSSAGRRDSIVAGAGIAGLKTAGYNVAILEANDRRAEGRIKTVPNRRLGGGLSRQGFAHVDRDQRHSGAAHGSSRASKFGELLSAYKNWGHDPYGGGWNFWAPGVDVKNVMQGIRRPFAEDPLYVVGEAYSGNQGWVEGALTTAEHALRDYFHLERADWQP